MHSPKVTTSERLAAYHPFDGKILENIERTAHQQNNLSFSELADQYGFSDGPMRFTYQNRLFEGLEFTPRGDYDQTEARVLFNPMSVPIDASTAVRAARLFGSSPSTRLLVVGNPALVGRRTNLPKTETYPELWRGDLASLSELSMMYLSKSGAEEVDVLGYSFGSYIGARAIRDVKFHEMLPRRAVLVEAPLTKGIVNLGRQFKESGNRLQDYVDAAASPLLNEARQKANFGLARYVGGLLRPANIAGIRIMAKADLTTELYRALNDTSLDHLTIAYGSESELLDPLAAYAMVAGLKKVFHGRVNGLRLTGMHHAGGDDIDLHAAIMLEGLRPRPQFAYGFAAQAALATFQTDSSPSTSIR